MNKIGLSIKDLSFAFNKKAFTFFNNLSLTFAPNKMHFIKGGNGVGKSTLFRLLQGKIDSNEVVNGFISLDGKDYNLVQLHKELRHVEEIKMVQQKFDLMLADQLSFTKNLQLANLPHFPGLDPLPTLKELPALIHRFSISMEVPVYLLSGGQRQMLAILMALQKPTKVLLLDEPTAALDDKNTAMVMQFLHELAGAAGLTILIISHDKEVVDRYAPLGYYKINLDESTLLRTVTFEEGK